MRTILISIHSQHALEPTLLLLVAWVSEMFHGDWHAGEELILRHQARQSLPSLNAERLQC